MLGRLALLSLVGGWLAAACGAQPPPAYTIDTRNDFLTACTTPGEDELVRIKLCQCTFDKLEQTIVYARFVEIEALLLANPTAPLPEEVAQAVAACVIEEVEL